MSSQSQEKNMPKPWEKTCNITTLLGLIVKDINSYLKDVYGLINMDYLGYI